MLVSVSQLSSDLTFGLLGRPLHDIAAHKKTSRGRFSVIAKPASGPFKEFDRRRTPSFAERLVVTLIGILPSGVIAVCPISNM
jgi:hypothetical protein